MSNPNLGKKFSSDFFWNAGSLASVGIVSLGLNVLILACRGDASLGVFNQVLTIYIILSQIAVCGIQFSVLNQCSRHPEDLNACHQSVLSAIILVGAISSIIAMVVFGLSGSLAYLLKSESVGEGVRCISWAIVFFSVNKVLLLLLNALRHMRAMAFFQAIRFVLIIAFIAFGLSFEWTDGQLPLALSLAEFVLSVALILYIRLRIFRLYLTFDGRLGNLLKKHFHFGLRGVFSGLLMETNTRTDILMLGIFLSDDLVGIYSFVAAFAEGFAQLIVAMRRNIDPLLGLYLSNNALTEIRQLAQKIRHRFYPFMGGVGLLLIIVFPFLLKYMSIQGPWQPYWYVLIILITGFILISGYNCFIGILLQGGAPGAFTILMLITVISNVSMNMILIPFCGIYGAAIATSMAYCVQTWLGVHIAKRLFDVDI